MKRFFSTFFASLLALLVGFFLVVIVTIAAISGIVASQEVKTELKENSIYKLELHKPIYDRSNRDPFQNFDPFTLDSEKDLGLDDILANIQKAADNPKIKGIYLDLGYVLASYATIQEIRLALEQFKESGKFVIAHGDYLSQKAYYLSTVADSIFINPEGLVEFIGLKSEVVFFKDALDKLGIEAQVIRHGKFKGAAEPFTRNSLSAENREQISSFANSIWSVIAQDIANSRKMSVERVNDLVNNPINSTTTINLLKNNIVDAAKYRNEIEQSLKSLSGLNADEDLRFVTHSQMKKVPEKREGEGLAKDKIAVIYASGTVQMGNEGEGTISSERIASAIKKARKDDDVKAIVFRINSGGGSALASEIIWHEALLAAEEKSFVASLGDVAASGGYYIACPADAIVASPVTITGSIGVFAIFPNAKELLNEKLGIHFDVVKTAEYADFASPYKSLSPLEKQAITIGIERIYETFIGHVAEGRGMEPHEIDSIGQGRVWSGKEAKEIGLIDEFGGLSRSIELAAEMAGLGYYRIESLPKQDEPLQAILEKLSEETKYMFVGSRDLKALYRETLNTLKQYSGYQAQMPYIIDFN